MTAPSDDLALVELDASFAREGFALSSAIGWNQTREDWKYMLQAGEGFARQAPDGALAATALALPYGAFAWICMVIVAPDYRRRGLASELMSKLIERQSSGGRIAGLDATPAGRKVYGGIGFKDHYGLARYSAAWPGASPLEANISATIRPLTAGDLAALADYDRPAFGGDRSALLGYLLGGQPGCAFGAWEAGMLRGFVLARAGRNATQLGPLVASDAGIAAALASAAMGAIDGPVFIDALDRHAPFVAWLKTSGFERQRPFTRMYLGRDTGFDRPQLIFAVAGPELG